MITEHDARIDGDTLYRHRYGAGTQAAYNGGGGGMPGGPPSAGGVDAEWASQVCAHCDCRIESAGNPCTFLDVACTLRRMARRQSRNLPAALDVCRMHE